MRQFSQTPFRCAAILGTALLSASCAASPEPARAPMPQAVKASPQNTDVTSGSENKKIMIAYKDWQPLLRVPPMMPKKARTSGHCKMRLDVSPDGIPFNVEALTCSKSLFKRSAIISVRKWRFLPTHINDEGLTGVESTVRFKLRDADGNIIPE